MNRRAFLASLAAAFALDPERALWVPGAKTISIPALIAEPPFIARDFSGWDYDAFFLSQYPHTKIGSAVRFRTPPRFRDRAA